MTPSQNYNLQIDMENFQNETSFVVYEQFVVDSEADGFRLTMAKYSGNAGKYMYE